MTSLEHKKLLRKFSCLKGISEIRLLVVPLFSSFIIKSHYNCPVPQFPSFHQTGINTNLVILVQILKVNFYQYFPNLNVEIILGKNIFQENFISVKKKEHILEYLLFSLTQHCPMMSVAGNNCDIINQFFCNGPEKLKRYK